MSQLYPAVIDPKTLTRQVWDVNTARRIPGVGRALGLICGLISQMELDEFAGIMPQPRPPFLENPDLDYVRSLFVALQIEDYLLQGNAAHLVTARHRGGARAGWPAATRWYPAHQWHVWEEAGRRLYWLNGREVPAVDVVHVQNGADPMAPYRGQGVVEKYVNDLDRIALESANERETLLGGSIPSVVVTLPPDTDEDDDDLDDAATKWEEKFGGTRRRPAMLPHGTVVTPLGWNPRDGQMAEVRQLGLQDTANMFNLDGYWLGAKASSHTYRTPGPLFLALLRTTLEGILAPFEDTWSLRWTSRGRRIVFNRQKILGDDFAPMVTALVTATGGPVLTPNEGRTRLQLAPIEGGDELRTPAAPPEPGEPAPDPDDEDQDDVDPDADDTEEGDEE